MIDVFVIADGPRDFDSIPALATTILGVPVRAGRQQAWKDIRLNRYGPDGLHGHGFDRKLMFAIARTREANLSGIIAVADRDKDRGGKRGRLQQLLDGRSRDREKHASVPTAVGCADPHVEAWLLDDAQAVRDGLSLSREAIVAINNAANPKAELDALFARVKIVPREGLAAIAALVESSRCSRPNETGFGAFNEDLRREFDSLARKPKS